ncbi:MAG TPA: nucleoside-diphosphate sugar epimerase/dehydratase [Candidatus Sulfomarinibacteraceae bacterium]|nr:nucleoside-diphosphate sugar epimerase/dehydratase [Candidatus Sulfomarinibacteraceae bacterium]
MKRTFVQRLRNRHFFALDLILLVFAAYFSFVLRLESLELSNFWPSYLIFALSATMLIPLVFRSTGIYSRYWRYASVDELLRLSGAVAIGSILAGFLTWLIVPALDGNYVFPRSIPFIFLLLALIVTAAPRLGIRVISRYRHHSSSSNPYKVAAIMGAGDAGAIIVRELKNNPQLGIEVAGFLDDDPAKHDMQIHGIPVLGDRYDIPRVVRNYNVSQIIIAMPTAPGMEIRDVVSICEKAGVQTKIIPGLYELLQGSVSINQLRDVDIEDLLRREPIKTDTAAVEQFLRDKRVLITGAGGSIGSELCRQIVRCRPRQMVLLGHGENSIFEIFHELRAKLPEGITITPVIADIRFPARMRSIFEQYRPQIVFHAAAHKHVPLMEENPLEAVSNNVLGTKYVLDAAKATNVEQFIMVSTDKAVNPTSIMGSTKRVSELLVHQAARETSKRYVTVRFGNVLGSRGSVILTFKRQIAQGGPVTVTHPEMKRYFMTIPEAVQLLLQAAVLGTGGEVFMLEMGKPVKIVDLARDLIELSGLDVGRDIEIEFIGTRPGEKLFEELFADGEKYMHTEHEQILNASNTSSFVPPQLQNSICKLAEAVDNESKQAVLETLFELVPEYSVNGDHSPDVKTNASDSPVLLTHQHADNNKQ